MTRRTTPAPPDLQAAGVALWRKATREWEFHSIELSVLHQLCAVTDEIEAMRADLAQMGMIVAGSEKQPRANPLIDKLVNHRRLADQLVVALALPIEGEAAGMRRSAKAKQSADHRWRRTKSKGRLTVVNQMQARDG
jgi:hypothetical protein